MLIAAALLLSSPAPLAKATFFVSSVRGIPQGEPKDLFRFDRLDDLGSYNPGGVNAPTLSLSQTNGFTAAIRATFDNPGNSWDSQIGRPTTGPVAAGDAVQIQFSAKTTGTAAITAIFEQALPPNGKTISQAIGTTGDWQDFRVTRQSTRAYGPGEAQVKFFFTGKGTAEISNVTVRNLGGIAGPFGIDDRLGKFVRVRDEALLKEARANIERLRKGKLSVVVLGSNGKPLAKRPVQVRLDRHAFRWGTAAVAGLINAQTPEGAKYREVIAREFNTIVFENDMKWTDQSPRGLNEALKALPWLQKNRIDVRGHNLVWGADSYLPQVVKNAPKEQRWPIVERHVREYAQATKGKVYIWDVVNEAVTNTQLWEDMGWDKFAQVYKIVREIDPKVRLAYNEYNITIPSHRRTAIERVKTLQAAGAPVDVFGDQAHYGIPESPARVVWDGWNEIARETKLPIEITEYDFGTFDEDYYAEQIEDTMTLAFGHPSMRAFVMWGFWEGAHWRANDGGHIVNRDFSYRAPMTRFHDLVHRRWSTDVTATTDSAGRINIPAFYGSYTLSSGGKTADYLHQQQVPGTKRAVTTLRLK